MTAELRQASAPPGNTAFAAFLAEAKAGRRGFWRVVATLALVVVAWFVLIEAVVALLGAKGVALLADPRVLTVAVLAALSTTPFVLAIAVRSLHGRPFAGLLGARRRIEGAPLLIGALAAATLSAVSLTLATGLGLVTVTPIAHYEPPWLMLAAAGALIPAQAAGEELVFRGYLLQEFGARAPHALAWAAAPSAIFALLHIDNGAGGAAAAAYVASTFLFGLAAAALVWRTAGLSAAIGLHVVNNWIAICLFEPAQGVTGLGPLAIRFQPGGEMPSLLLDAVLLGLALFALWRILPPVQRPAAP